MEGDGSFLMNFNTLPTLAKYKPDNLCIFLLDNRSYETTGSQESYNITEFNLGELLSYCMAMANAVGRKLQGVQKLNYL